MTEKMVTLGKNGRLVIPASYRKKMGVAEGDKLVLHYEDETIKIMTLRQAVRFAQSLVRRYVPKQHSLAVELIAERKRESRDE
jgi:AbrB family looped-hinge helix DNA binding protein